MFAINLMLFCAATVKRGEPQKIGQMPRKPQRTTYMQLYVDVINYYKISRFNKLPVDCFKIACRNFPYLKVFSFCIVRLVDSHLNAIIAAIRLHASINKNIFFIAIRGHPTREGERWSSSFFTCEVSLSTLEMRCSGSLFKNLK